MKGIIFLLLVCLITINEANVNILNFLIKIGQITKIVKLRQQQSISKAIQFCLDFKMFSSKSCQNFVAMIPPKGGFKLPGGGVVA